MFQWLFGKKENIATGVKAGKARNGNGIAGKRSAVPGSKPSASRKQKKSGVISSGASHANRPAAKFYKEINDIDRLIELGRTISFFVVSVGSESIISVPGLQGFGEDAKYVMAVVFPVTAKDCNGLHFPYHPKHFERAQRDSEVRFFVYYLATARVLERNAALLKKLSFFVGKKVLADSHSKLAAPPSTFRVNRDLLERVAHIANENRKKAQSSAVLDNEDDNTEERRAVKAICYKALRRNASDIHITILKNENRGIIKYRINGFLVEDRDVSYDSETLLSIVRAAYNTMTDTSSRKDDFSEDKFLDAKISLPMPDDRKGMLNIRYNSMPIAGGVDVTLRVLVEGASSDGKRYLTYEQMGYTSAQSHVIRRAFNRSSGMAVVGGTTGSGKSTTLQNTIEYLIERYPTRKYRTLEDPVEYEIRGASQTSVSSSSAKGEDDVATLYNRALSAILRADPDFVMIGEIRNRSTADLAIKAATTGHQVATTLHTQSWASIYSRFANMGFSYSELAQEGIFVLLMVQRLVPILCQNCRIPFSEAVNMYEHDNEFIEIRERLVRAVGEDYLDRIFFENKKGCEHCLTTSSAGIAGREVCAEVALVDEAICEAVQTGRISEIEKVWRMRRATDDLRVIDPDTMGEGWKMAEIAVAKMLHGKCSPVHIEHLFCLVDDIVQYGMIVENQKGISVEAEACVRASGM